MRVIDGIERLSSHNQCVDEVGHSCERVWTDPGGPIPNNLVIYSPVVRARERPGGLLPH